MKLGPFETLEWELGDWAVISYPIVFARNYVVYRKGEAITFANSVADGVEYSIRCMGEDND